MRFFALVKGDAKRCGLKATSRKQMSEVRYQNIKVSPAAIYLNISNNACKMDAPGSDSS